MIRRATLIGVVVLALASGCTRTEAGDPQPNPGTDAQPSAPETPKSPENTQQQLAPSVEAPKDARNAAACDAVRPEQITALGLDPNSRRDLPLPDPFTAGCAWTSADSAWGVGLGFDTSTEGLTTLYKARANFGHFEPRAIDGYPAVDAQTAFSAEDCYTYVGVADTQTLYVNVDNRPALSSTPLTPPCERLDEIVRIVIGNLPPLE